MSMTTTLRQLFNSVDRLFDQQAIVQETRFSRDGGGVIAPATSGQALKTVLPVIRKLDWNARLKMIVSQPGIDQDGASPHWEFFFDLPRRRAQAACEWILLWDEKMDRYGPGIIEVAVRPFPPENSPIRQLVSSGELLHRQLYGLWEQERRRKPDLPLRFIDSSAALAEFIRQGLDIGRDEFSLVTGQSPEGHICWIAQARQKAYYAPFSA